MFELTKTQHRVTTAYHPQSNGLTERFNQTLSNCLRAKVNENQDNWDEHLQLILFTYRATKQNTTGFSPFYMMFACQPSFPIDSELQNNEESVNDSIENYKEVIDNLRSIHKLVTSTAESNIKKAQKKQKDQYDAKHQLPLFCVRWMVGEEVLVETAA